MKMQYIWKIFSVYRRFFLPSICPLKRSCRTLGKYKQKGQKKRCFDRKTALFFLAATLATAPRKAPPLGALPRKRARGQLRCKILATFHNLPSPSATPPPLPLGEAFSVAPIIPKSAEEASPLPKLLCCRFSAKNAEKRAFFGCDMCRFRCKTVCG